MIYLKKISKEEFGKLLLPEKILTFKFKESFNKLYEKVHFDNINPAIITNIFAISQIISIIFYILVYRYLYINFAGIIDSGSILRFLFIFVARFFYKHYQFL